MQAKLLVCQGWDVCLRHAIGADWETKIIYLMWIRAEVEYRPALLELYISNNFANHRRGQPPNRSDIVIHMSPECRAAKNGGAGQSISPDAQKYLPPPAQPPWRYRGWPAR